MDEVGRGTGYLHGISISAGTLLYISKNIKCRTLFATHFGTPLSDCLARLASRETSSLSDKKESFGDAVTFNGLKNLEDFEFHCTGITVQDKRERPEMFSDPDTDFKAVYAKDCKFDRKLVPGICDNSHGLLVAMLNGKFS